MRARDSRLDVIKLIAIILVIIYHSFYIGNTGVCHGIIISLCSMGVPLFFIVNGALLLPPPENIQWEKAL